VWDTEENKILNPETYHIDFFDSEEIFVKDTVNCRSKKYVELMQYTGLKDKNGKEIYEGDILAIPSIWHESILDDGSGPDEPYTQLVEMEFRDGCFGCVMEADSYFSDRFYSIKEITEEITDEPIEVIGNIYENPELIIKK
jgi:uncharacterized phage protein (TIGR01671 family)